MMWAMLILIVGLLLIYLEFYLPGGVMGVAGGLILLGNIVVFSLSSESPLFVVIIIITTLVGVVAVAKIALWRIRSAKPEDSIYLEGDQEGFKASEYAEDIVGMEGVAASNLRPSGHIVVESKKYQAVSKSGYISKGSKIIVSGGEGAHLQVKCIKKER